MEKSDINLLASLNNPARKFLGLIFGILGLIFLTTCLILIYINDFPVKNLFNFPPQNTALPYFLPLTAGVILFIIGFLLFLVHKIKIRKLITTLKKGAEQNARIIQNYQDFNVRVNNIPQRVIYIESNSKKYELKFFNEQLASILSIGTILPIIIFKETAVISPTFLKKLANP